MPPNGCVRDDCPMNELRFEMVRHETDFGQIDIEVAVRGTGPMILCIHGWPESWYSWRHQMAYFAGRGYTVAAMSVRGYGRSSTPAEIAAYTLRELALDATAVIGALGDGPAIVLGHDWGAPIAWNTARLHPNEVRAVCGLSVPYFPVGPNNSLDNWRAMFTDQGKFFYQVYFDENVGGAEAELAADSLNSLRRIYYAASADAGENDFLTHKPNTARMLDGMVDPDPFPAWASDDDLAVYADAFAVSGWHGGLNRYRAQPLDAQDIGQMPHPNLTQPAAFIGGSKDLVRGFSAELDVYDAAVAGMACDDFRGSTVIDGIGHWTQQEAPDAVNKALAEFFAGL